MALLVSVFKLILSQKVDFHTADNAKSAFQNSFYIAKNNLFFRLNFDY